MKPDYGKVSDQVGREVEDEIQGQVRGEVSRKRKRAVPLDVIPNSEAIQRLEAYKWMVSQGKLKGLRVKDSHCHSVDCQELSCDHEREDDGTCSELRPTLIELKSVLETFTNVMKTY